MQRFVPSRAWKKDPQFRTRYGPWAVVTGASSGIGRAMAEELAQAGLDLVLVARSLDSLERVAADLRIQYGIEAQVVGADLSLASDIEAVLAATHKLDVGLVVAAAGFGTSGPFLESVLDHELDMLAVNCRALMVLCLEFGRRFARRGQGGMILMSSIVAFQGTPYAAHYAATKAYVQTLAEALHVELAPLGIDVLAPAPGPTNSGFAARANMRMSLALEPVVVAQSTLASLGHRSTVLPGRLSRLLAWALLPLPRWARSRVMGRVMRGMTHHRQPAGPALADRE